MLEWRSRGAAIVIPLKDDIPTQSTPYVTIGLIVLNAALFVRLLMMPAAA